MGRFAVTIGYLFAYNPPVIRMSQAVLKIGMVCTPQPYAVDAALVAALVQGVEDFHMGGPGGYMLLTQFWPWGRLGSCTARPWTDL